MYDTLISSSWVTLSNKPCILRCWQVQGRGDILLCSSRLFSKQGHYASHTATSC